MSKKQQEAEQTVNQLGSIWTESSAKFKAELERLQRELAQTEVKRLAAEKALKNARVDNKSQNNFKSENRRLKKELAEFASALRFEQARAEETNRLKDLNKLLLKRLEVLKEENVELKSVVEMGRVSEQVATWQSEMSEYKLRELERLLELERAHRAQLEDEVRARAAEQTAAVARLQNALAAAADAEVAGFEARMQVEQSEERAAEANMNAARSQEAMEDALRQKEGALEAVEKLMEERQELKRLLAKMTGERDFMEWQCLQMSSMKCVEWIEPGEPQWETPSEDNWHSNTLFGQMNLLYESPESL